MNSIDIAVLLVLILSTLVGFVRGGLSSILSTTGWVVAIVANHHLFNSVEPFLEARFNSKLLTFLVGYIGGIVLILFLVSIVNFMILSALSQFRGGSIDRVLGLIFGGVRGILVIAVVFLCFESGMKALSGEENNTKNYPEILLDAKSLPLVKKAELTLISYVPANFRASLSLKNITLSDEQVSDITLLNLVRKLSTNIPENDLASINKSVEKNEQYMSQRQVLIEKINIMWKYYNENRIQKSSLTKDDLKKIHTITS